MKRVFLMVLDSFGVGAAPDAAEFGDAGSSTLGSLLAVPGFDAPNLRALGLFNIDGVKGPACAEPEGAYGRLTEVSRGKDTTIGHWELAGVISPKPLPTYPNGFPLEVIAEFERRTGRKALCNRPYSGTQVIYDYGREQIQTGALIVYTSADSVFQIAAHEQYIGLEELYRCCKIARELVPVGRVIARPYIGEWPDFTRTTNRHDFSLLPPGPTLPRAVADAGLASIGVGKIKDVFAGDGITRHQPIAGNTDGMAKTLAIAREDFHGLCFVNLVDYDSLYGHRRDAVGYARAIMEFDTWLPTMRAALGPEDVLMITADHGCDPGYSGTDHTREYVPALICGAGIRSCALGTRACFADLGKTAAELLGVAAPFAGESFAEEILK